MIRLAQEGQSPEEIARVLGCTVATVYGNLPANWETPHQRRMRCDRPVIEATVLDLRRNGLTIKQIGEELGMSYSTVQRLLSRLTIKEEH